MRINGSGLLLIILGVIESLRALVTSEVSFFGFLGMLFVTFLLSLFFREES